jgi:hypothetical protein
LHVSMLEVYNEKIKDLLAGNPSEATKKWVYSFALAMI